MAGTSPAMTLIGGTSMPDLKMTLACWNYDRTRALMDGSVKPEGIDLTYHNSFPAVTFHRMMGKREFEASELGLTFYLDTLHEDDRRSSPFRSIRSGCSPIRRSTSTPTRASSSRRILSARRSASSSFMATTPAPGRKASCRTTTACRSTAIRTTSAA
jgi:4,5-dihydroxyphthalate decarboxylase